MIVGMHDPITVQIPVIISPITSANGIRGSLGKNGRASKYAPQYIDSQTIHGLRGSSIPAKNPTIANHPIIAVKSGLNVALPDISDCIFHIEAPRAIDSKDISKVRASRKRLRLEGLRRSTVAGVDESENW
jgi:hypothetical protein